jgi:hypothetical protein
MHRIPFFIAAYIILATALSYIVPVSSVFLWIVAGCSAIAAWFLAPQSTPTSLPWIPASRHERTALTLAAITILGCIFILSRHASTDALLSPWQLFPDWLFVIYALSTLGLYIGTRTASRTGWLLFALMLFVATSVASFVYTLGYGFDGFVHRAAMDIIIRDGVLLPRTPYYIGAYLLEIGVHLFTHIRLFLIDQWFVPVIAAMVIPFAQYIIGLPTRIAVLVLAFPLAFFITTTPQSVAFLLLILAMAYANTPTRSWRTWLLATLLAIAACTAHPVAGIPALLLVLLSWLWTRQRTAAIALAILGSFALPLIFVLTQGARISWTGIHQLFLTIIAAPTLITGVSMPLQFTYTYFFVVLPLTVVLLVLIAYRTVHARVVPYLLGAASCLGASLLLRCLTYRNVISYEQSAFGDRLFIIAIICLFPVLTVAIIHLATTWQWDRRSRISFALLFALSAAASWYLTYPRIDVVDRSKGYSTSATDFATVTAIHQDAEGTASYIVLTNQSVSAAAVATFGFHPNVHLAGTEQFIYPIPTGGPLYPYYLRMVYQSPTRAHALGAADAANVTQVYLVITPYWHNARRLIEVARSEADDTFVVGSNHIFVFKK